eukprot:CAMPEP_0197733600 /NCGR_PEP_ID=MMETSP1434-20131217/43983_1 /TAXON_ID=265543 /ORGANISM="Minutocellus polymorphus, Strain CCMP3303" /LENGTH=238 /DNA_ID=CAMNT_0043320979 /DNA_START=40 /DNA_END=756 /DNA_ORIENTATION=+
MRLTAAIIATLAGSSVAFAPQHSLVQRSPSSALRMSTEAVPITVTGNNIEVTPALNDYVVKKLERTVGKLASSGAVKDCDVHLIVNKNPKVEEPHKAEIVTSLKGTVIRCAEESADMYKSIDEVCDRLNRKLVKYKERRLEGFHGGKSMSEDLADALNAVEVSGEDGAAVEDFVDPDAPTITKVKSYDLSKKISVQEAVFALDYVDHDFYVFRNDEDGEINVVYKRNAGGVGLIQPSQ